MITEDLAIVKELFSILDQGIVDGYDAFQYEVKVGKGWVETQLTAERNGVEITDVETDFSNAVIFKLVKQLRQSGAQRGDHWTAFTLSYRRGEQVRTFFSYGPGSSPDPQV
ncbi:hypothetical protein [Pseudomonas mosselii]|uniref:Uncharacterized protein n=1 Tax=Pseudomonas mosselii TaxID=78327 RepID=A0ABX9AT46_9PSED|nr:hypothetical protein [Pseudomonas mosselii]MBC3451524.1 hypothetical protein [Pseudomonas mosselii]MBH3311835.1 hypothetical protein [Pseudomonas mosselii]MBH3326100.1 hypothetical protein [Pseudomonas mosselii]MCL8302761.1 hypothetical protein [Pseudomonas mosselii]MCL8342993.1 hypothetical protein [Pseudomonas mosselii]